MRAPWISVFDQSPPSNEEVLVKDPSGIVYLANWRSGYNIFTVQNKGDNSSDWQWKLI